MKPVVWTIAGMDNTGGAGISLDVRVLEALGVHSCSVVTAVTAQSSEAVIWESVSETLLRQQIETLLESQPPQVVKLGMLGSADTLRVLSEYLDILKGRGVKIICDPIIAASNRHRLLEVEAQQLLTEKIFPFVDVLTPNIPEVEELLAKKISLKISSWSTMEHAANKFLDQGVQSVVLKGGHLRQPLAVDYWTDGKQQAWLVQDRVPGTFRGTGCAFSSALAAAWTIEPELLDAVVVAKASVQQSLKHTRDTVFISPKSWPNQPEVLPRLVSTASDIEQRYVFPDCGPAPLGFYPIVPRAEWVKRLVELGVKTIQLRVKDLQGELLVREVQESLSICKKNGSRFFLNDYWELAIELGAYGVHLGQEDLAVADLRAIEKAGLRLGVSTHSYAEMARAVALKPSYIAVGPIYPTTCKSMRFGPQGLDRLRQFQKLLSGPAVPGACRVVAIGGITLEKAPGVLSTGVDGIAVVSDILESKNLTERVTDWIKFWRHNASLSSLVAE